MIKEKKSSKVKVHTRYKLANGDLIPGTTTITGLRAKPQLIKWANNLGLQGIDSTKYTDEKADIGTIAHYLILCHLRHETPDLKDYSQNNIDQAENSFLKFLDWEKHHTLKPILLETPLVSENLKFGGTVDFYGSINDVLTLKDFKTSNAIWDEQFYQLAGYKLLLQENGYKTDKCGILRIGRTEDEGFEEQDRDNIEIETNIFLALLSIYHNEKLLRKNK